MTPQLVSAYHLESVFHSERSANRVQNAVKALRPHNPDVIVVTGISGIVLGSRVAEHLQCKLAVVRRDMETRMTHSGSARDVEGWLGGRWVFFDDIIASGSTARHASSAYERACAEAGIPCEFLGTYLHVDNQFYLGQLF